MANKVLDLTVLDAPGAGDFVFLNGQKLNVPEEAKDGETFVAWVESLAAEGLVTHVLDKNVGQGEIHFGKWLNIVNAEIGEPDECEGCGAAGPLENVNGDWVCPSCEARLQED